MLKVEWEEIIIGVVLKCRFQIDNIGKVVIGVLDNFFDSGIL